MLVCQVTGYKNSGKTSVMNELIRYFSKENLKVGSLKHHGHGGEPDMVEGTDSQGHLESGSVISGVQGENTTQLTISMPLELDELIQMYRRFPLDLLMVEGYKQAAYPKIVLIKNEADLSLLQELSAIIAVGTWDAKMAVNLDIPVFDMNSLETNIPALADCIRRDL
ncbi:molybdopterin-guanine dinucleotide biosynthesis protein B [Lentibacillus juripiscarius]|uniref:Molybdopterin-guanine dinucleotide biosynthesis protein B n=1 Tax=Lentibacillus juripiscarius TaxID=257446 RepID=A0ABW5VAQ6_9BACI